MTTRALLAALVLAPALAACGGGDSFSLGSLVGSYEIEPGCVVRAEGSQVSASCSDTERLKLVGHVFTSVGLSATVAEDRIAVTLTMAGHPSLGYWDDVQRCDCTYTVTGSVHKSSGRVVDGAFAPLAGTWTGEGIVEIMCEDHPGETCNEDSRGHAHHVDAEIFGNTARIEGYEVLGGGHRYNYWLVDVADRDTEIVVNDSHARKL